MDFNRWQFRSVGSGSLVCCVEKDSEDFFIQWEGNLFLMSVTVINLVICFAIPGLYTPLTQD